MSDWRHLFSATVLIGIWCGTARWTYFLLSLPMRRRERSRLVLDLLDQAMERGESPETALASLDGMVGLSLGKPFHRLCRLAEQGAPLDAVLAKSRRLLPSRISALLRLGLRTGELPRLLPVCRKLLPDTTAQAHKAYHYLVLSLVGITPIWTLLVFFRVFLLPKLVAITEAFAGHDTFARFEVWFPWMIRIQGFALALLWLGTLLLIAGPALRLPWDRLALWLPWQRARLQRDFSALLAGFLDAPLPAARGNSP